MIDKIINNGLFTVTNVAAIGAIAIFWLFVIFSVTESKKD